MLPADAQPRLAGGTVNAALAAQNAGAADGDVGADPDLPTLVSWIHHPFLFCLFEMPRFTNEAQGQLLRFQWLVVGCPRSGLMDIGQAGKHFFPSLLGSQASSQPALSVTGAASGLLSLQRRALRR